MKSPRMKMIWTIALCLFSLATVMHAETWEAVKTKVINQSFSVNKTSLLAVDNRYGNITLSHWNKSEVAIRVEIEVAASRDKSAQQSLDRVKIDIRQSGDKISAVTSFTDNSNFRNQRLTINYFISIPSTMKLELNQKYGDIILPEKNDGESLLTVKYGNIHGGNFTKSLNLDAKYSNVSLLDLNNATLSLGYCGDAKVGSSKQLDVDSKYSTLQIGDADVLSVSMKYGNLQAGEVRQAALSIKYSDASINVLKEELAVESLDYSNLKIRELNPIFKRVTASSRYGTLEIHIDPRASFKIDAESMGDNLSIQGLKETKHSVESKSDHYVEINGGASRKINFYGNKYSTLRVRGK